MPALGVIHPACDESAALMLTKQQYLDALAYCREHDGCFCAVDAPFADAAEAVV
jgi:hypothetical protein